MTVDWLPNNTSSITAANAAVEAQASGGAAPDLVWEQYGPVTSGSDPRRSAPKHKTVPRSA